VPTGVGDAVLVPDERCAAAAGEPDEHRSVVRARAADEVEHVEVARRVRKRFREALELDRAAMGPVAASGNVVPAVVDADISGDRPRAGDGEPARDVAGQVLRASGEAAGSQE
jgi:hypothetical protein